MATVGAAGGLRAVSPHSSRDGLRPARAIGSCCLAALREDAGHGDTWEWDGTAWTEESDFGPEACAGAAMVFKGTRMALFGGIASIATRVPQPHRSLQSELGVGWEALDGATEYGAG